MTSTRSPSLCSITALLTAAALGAQDPDLFEILDQNQLSPWRVLGPFPGEARGGQSTGLDQAFIAETAPDFGKEHTLPDGSTLRWQDAAEGWADARANAFGSLGTTDHDTVYLARTVTAIADHEAVLAIGFDDSGVLWVNGEEVFRRADNQSVTVGEFKIKAPLRKGENSILFKVVNNRGPMGFAFEVTDQLDADGNRWGAGLPDDGFGAYRIETVPVPDALRMEVGGLLFLPDDSLLVCCRRGQIYQIHNPGEDDPEKLRITTFAEGLHEPLGMLLDDDGSVLVTQKPEMTRLRDTDGDGRADEFETVVAPWGLSGNYHEYNFGPVRDGQGYLWGTLNIGFPSGKGDELLYRGSAYRVSPDGEFLITCTGLRSPNGLMTYRDGEVFYTDNQGEWMDVCRLAHLQPLHNYGHKVPLGWSEKMTDFGWQEERTLPAVWYPYHLVRSLSWPVEDTTGGKFGPYRGQILVGDQNNSLLVRTTLQKVGLQNGGSVYQGACYPFWQRFAGGVNRLAFDRDGVLYVGITNRGWGSVMSKPYGLQRMRYVGPEPFDLMEVTATATGFDLRFNRPLSEDSHTQPRAVFVREYGYKYWSTYGSSEFDSRRVEVTATALSADRTTLSVTTGERNTGKAFQISLRGVVRSADGAQPITREAFYTLLAIPAE